MKNNPPPERGIRLRNWLRRCLRGEALAELFSGALFGTLGLIVFLVTNVGAVVLCVFQFSSLTLLYPRRPSPRFTDYSTTRPAIISGLAVLVVMTLSFRHAWKNRHRMDAIDLTFGPPKKHFRNRPVSFASQFINVFTSGPSLLINAGESGAGFLRLMRCDVSPVAAILLWLFDRGKKARLREIMAAFPKFNVVKVLTQLRDVPGVIWLLESRGVIMLSQELRDELGRVLEPAALKLPPIDEPAREPASDNEPEIPPAPNEEIFAWYEALELPAFAPLPEVKKRYRQLVKIYHPDAAAGKRGQPGVSEEKIKEINVAYHQILDHWRQASEPPV